MGKSQPSRWAGPSAAPDMDVEDTGPGRISGARITPWNGPPQVDLVSLFAKDSTGTTVSGGGGTPPSASEQPVPPPTVVCLSDGTEITFAETQPASARETA